MIKRLNDEVEESRNLKSMVQSMYQQFIEKNPSHLEPKIHGLQSDLHHVLNRVEALTVSTKGFENELTEMKSRRSSLSFINVPNELDENGSEIVLTPKKDDETNSNTNNNNNNNNNNNTDSNNNNTSESQDNGTEPAVDETNLEEDGNHIITESELESGDKEVFLNNDMKKLHKKIISLRKFIQQKFINLEQKFMITLPTEQFLFTSLVDSILPITTDNMANSDNATTATTTTDIANMTTDNTVINNGVGNDTNTNMHVSNNNLSQISLQDVLITLSKQIQENSLLLQETSQTSTEHSLKLKETTDSLLDHHEDILALKGDLYDNVENIQNLTSDLELFKHRLDPDKIKLTTQMLDELLTKTIPEIKEVLAKKSNTIDMEKMIFTKIEETQNLSKQSFLVQNEFNDKLTADLELFQKLYNKLNNLKADRLVLIVCIDMYY